MLSALVVIQSGCKSLSPNGTGSPIEKMAASLQGNDAELVASSEQVSSSPAAKMVVVWKENVLQSDSGRPVQGFTGRVYFHDVAGNIVQVEGELNIYGYDDSGEMRKRVPDKHFVFESDKFASHYSPTELGHSYSFWLPWCDYGGIRKMITLVPVFKSGDNRIVEGTADYLTLSGRAPENHGLEMTIATPIPQSNRDPNQYNHANQQSRRVQTIPVPQTITDEWNRAAQLQRIEHARNRFMQQDPVTMNLMDQAEGQPDGRGFNQVHVNQQQLNAPNPVPPMPNRQQMISHPRPGNTPVQNRMPVQNNQTMQASGQMQSPTAAVTSPSDAVGPTNHGRYNRPAVYNQPVSQSPPANFPAANPPGVRTALGDLAPVGNYSTANQAPVGQNINSQQGHHVFGQPGSIR